MNDDPRIDETARRVQDAVTAHGRTVHPDDDASLAVIRHRVATARRRRLVGATALGAAAALVIGVAIGIAAGGDDTTTVAAGDGGSTTTTTPPCQPSSTLPPSTTTTTADPSTASIPTTSTAPTNSAAAGGSTTTIVPANAPLTAVPETTIPAPGQSLDELIERRAEDDCAGPTTGTVPTTGTTTTTSTTTTSAPPPPDGLVVFPINGLVPPDGSWPWPDPESTARGFLEAIGVADPALGPFESTGPDVGRILLHGRDEGGTVRTDIERSVLELGRVDGHWVVLAATSSSIVIDGLGIEERAPGSKAVVVTGRGRGFEGTLHVRAIGHGDVLFDRSAVVTASGGEELMAFRAELDMAGSSGQVATIVVTNDSGLDGGPVDVAAYAFRLP